MLWSGAFQEVITLPQYPAENQLSPGLVARHTGSTDSVSAPGNSLSRIYSRAT